MYLFNLLKEYLEPSCLELLKEFDKLPFEKKVAVLRLIKEAIKEPTVPAVSFQNEEKYPLEWFLEPLDKVKGLDFKEKKLLKSLGVEDILSALWFLPVRYEDRRLSTSVRTALPGKRYALKVKVVELREDSSDTYPLRVVCTDGTGYLVLRFRYKDPRVKLRFKPSTQLIVYGRVKEFQGEKYMVHPEILSEEEAGSILPFYNIRTKNEQSLSAKTRHKRVRKAMFHITELAKHMPEYIPREILQKYNFLEIGESFYLTHRPPTGDEETLNSFLAPFQRRLVYDELFIFQLALQLRRSEIRSQKAPTLKEGKEWVEQFVSSLPFELTGAQKRVIQEILTDVEKEVPMSRLLQGDVGSGKTVVAMAISYAFAKEGYQTAVMVPTEILARQHYENFRKFLEPMGVRVGLLTSSVKGRERLSVKYHTARGHLHILIGTHALLQEEVEFNRLGFVVVDEQHRFGVLQRKILLQKGRGFYPHCLVMSATPIPRTLALSLYGDLDVSFLDQMPAGRKPVITTIVFESRTEEMLEVIRRELQAGHRVYVIYPLIEESERLSLKAATTEYERWKNLFPERNVLLLHGKMKDSEKIAIMEEFREKGDILVSTSVVEVGVDVPTATVMVIESAHRFGLSQLHQLRGRVGRSNLTSYCFLVVPDQERYSPAMRRLKVLVSTYDGFKIAEEDMLMRGPGELLGESQSGFFGFRVANFMREQDRRLLELAREDASELIKKDPFLLNHADLRKMVLYRYGDKMDLSHIA